MGDASGDDGLVGIVGAHDGIDDQFDLDDCKQIALTNVKQETLSTCDRSKMVFYSLQALNNLTLMDIPTMNSIVLQNPALMPLLKNVFDNVYGTYDSVSSSDEYIEILDAYVRVMRNIVTIGIPHE